MKIDRRRLLKGSLAAPVVLTVRPASAQAQGSAVACLTRSEAAARSDPPDRFVHSARRDEWMRVEIELSRLAPSHGKEFYGGKYFLGFDKHTYWRLDDRRPYDGPATVSDHTRGSCYEQKTGERLYALAFVDQYGNVTGFGWDRTQLGAPATTSCLISAVGLRQRA
jgi:hypothetical protein